MTPRPRYVAVMAAFVTTRRVEFCDTDMAGIVHFANYYRYMEQAEHDLFRAYGLKISDKLPDGARCGWPRVSATCSFTAPAFYDDLLEIHVLITQRTARALTTSYQFRRDGQLLAEGEMKTVFCIFPPGQRMQSATMPDDIAAKLDAAANG
jgi:acyl-CoA thioester hydrolase